MKIEILLLIYIAMISIISFILMGVDKLKAISVKWRIKELTLFTVALIGGGIGSILGMIVFHHKTKKWYFVLFMPLLALLQMILYFIIL